MSATKLFSYGPSNVDSLLATTKSVIAEAKDFLNDAIFNRITLLKWLNEKALVTRQGGASILVPILYGKNGTFKAYAADDVIDTTGQEGITMAQYPWRNYGGTITIFGDEMRANMGNGKIYDLIKAKTMQSMMSARDALAVDMFLSTQGSKKVGALPVLVDQTSTVADINSTTNSWWQSQLVTSGSFSAQGLADWRTIRDRIVNAGQSGAPLPDLILTTPTVFEAYEASQISNIRYVNESKNANAAFDSLKWGAAIVDHDPNCSSGLAFFLCTDSLEFVVHSEANWNVGDFIEPVNQDVRAAKVIWMGNLVAKNRRRLGKVTSITA